MKTFLAGRVFGEAVGIGAPSLLALHGWGRTHGDFRNIFGDSGAILLDLPGFGASPTPPTAWTTREYAQFLLPMLNHLTSPKIVVGHSFGGRVAVQMAAAVDDIDHLILVGTPLLRDTDRRVPRVYGAVKRLRSAGLLPESLLEKARRKYGSTDYNAAQGVMRGVLVSAANESYADQLAAITCRTTLITGEFDTAAKPAMVQRAATMLSAGSAVIVPHAGHQLDDVLGVEIARRVLGGT